MKDLSDSQLRDFAEGDSVCYQKIIEVCGISSQIKSAMDNTKDNNRPADDFVEDGSTEVLENTSSRIVPPIENSNHAPLPQRPGVVYVFDPNKSNR